LVKIGKRLSQENKPDDWKPVRPPYKKPSLQALATNENVWQKLGCCQEHNPDILARARPMSAVRVFAHLLNFVLLD